MQTGFGGDEPEAIYQKSVQQGKKFSESSMGLFFGNEVNNEGDNKIRVKNKPDGATSGEYVY